MNEKPLVSVITTFLNAEDFIEEAIESVANQTFTNWEFLLIDDGSTDKSTIIATNYCEKYPTKIRYLEHENHLNKGISASRNLGIKNAKGKYIATLDADDVWVINKLQDQVSIMESNPRVGMVYGDTKWWFSWTGDPLDKERDCYEHDLIKPGSLELNTVIEPPTLMTLRLRGDIAGPSMSNIMFRKNVLDEIGGFEEVFTGMHEDWAIWAKILLSTPVYVSAKCWDMTREHPDSCVAVATKEGRLRSSELFYLNWLKQYFLTKSVDDPELLDALRKRIWKYNHPHLLKLSYHSKRFTQRLYKLISIITRRLLNVRS